LLLLLSLLLLLLTASAHAHAHSHSKVASHSVVEHHSFEFSVSAEAKNNRDDIVSGQETDDCELEGRRGIWICELGLKTLGLDYQADDVDIGEEVDRDVHYVEG